MSDGFFYYLERIIHRPRNRRPTRRLRRRCPHLRQRPSCASWKTSLRRRLIHRHLHPMLIKLNF